MTALRRREVIAAVAVAIAFAAAIAVIATAASPAQAFERWVHDGATECVACHNSDGPSDASCTACHAAFHSAPDNTCWSCHAPGQDTSSFSSPSSACSQTCHQYSTSTRDYTSSFSHGTNPHLGSAPQCLGCHEASPGVADPGLSPHHNESQQGFTQCTTCHAGFAKHASRVACTLCHSLASTFHLYQASSPGFTKCAGCHAMKHAGKNVSQSKCATCHKGTGTGRGAQAQHSVTVTKKRVCSACHDQKLHASARGSGIQSCSVCHKGHYHAKQKLPRASVCTTCHETAGRHSNGFACALCHKRAIHNVRPTVAKATRL